jgi:hypothetical protein
MKSSYIRLVHIITLTFFTNVDLFYIENTLFYLLEGLGRLGPVNPWIFTLEKSEG